MKIELHMIQNFAPSCLNRDDTNSPKDCLFGGVRRARISSQCIKRSIRKAFREQALLPAESLAVRTKRLVDNTADKLAAKGKDVEAARGVVRAALGGIGLGVGDDSQTQYLLFVSQAGLDALADACLKHWDALVKASAPAAAVASTAKPKKSARDAKKESKAAVPEEVGKAVEKLLDGQSAADLALFGRMLADMKGANIDAACQVAHAVSTNKVSMEMDFYTAVDDLKTDSDDAGAGMMGVVGYNSACFYRYAVLDVGQLVTNLGGDKALARKTIEAFLRASATAVPTGKQNTFAAHSRPDLIGVAIRNGGAPLSLANAFVAPARPTWDKDAQRELDLTEASVQALADHWAKVAGVYGTDGCDGVHFCATTTPPQLPQGWNNVGTLDALIAKVLAAVDGEARA